MSASIFQRLRLALRGWSRRRSEESVRKQDEFLKRSAGWGNAPSAAAAASVKPHAAPERSDIDLEGLHVAYLDDSARIAYYLDVSTGEVIELALDDAAQQATIDADPVRYLAVPSRTEASEAADRRAFVAGLDSTAAKNRLLSLAGDAARFRTEIGADRKLERAWYNFKNDRALKVIENWLGTTGIRE